MSLRLEVGHAPKGAALNEQQSVDSSDLDLQPGERWLCVQTGPRKELVAGANLSLQGYRNFVPTVIRQIKHARRVTKVRSAFFPRYIFAIIATETQSWRPINGTIGVSSLIMENSRPKMVPAGIVEALIKSTNGQGLLDFRDELQIGRQVRLLDGPFANLVGELARLDHKGRVAILLKVMGGERLVAAERATLQAVA